MRSSRLTIEREGVPLTALEPGGHVRIPAEIFPLPAGSELSLSLDSRGTSRSLSLHRVSGPI